MGGLVLKLSPKERLLINGAVIENGDRRSRLSVVTPNANILRLRDAIHPDDANTPVKRACYAIQLVLSGDTDIEDAKRSMLKRLEELSQVFTDADSRAQLSRATEALIGDNPYQCLKSIRALIPRETRILAHGMEQSPERSL
ncbi:MAG: flagellar biosynthesis repressor FlbT [Pseudomonadota bacterium]